MNLTFEEDEWTYLSRNLYDINKLIELWKEI